MPLFHRDIVDVNVAATSVGHFGPIKSVSSVINQILCIALPRIAVYDFRLARKHVVQGTSLTQCDVLQSFIALCKQRLYSSCAEKLFLSVTQ